jgi:K+-sensing histidine kinase KdpD
LSKLRRRIVPDSYQAYAFALSCIAVATLSEFALLSLDEDISPLETFYPAVLFAALIGGIGPGIVAAIGGGVIVWWGLMPPRFAFALSEYGDRITLVTYIVAAELGPYVASRVEIRGSNPLLPPKHALTLALLLHELATNSAKYGAFSVSGGRVSVTSSMAHPVLSIEWRESGGPAVSAPTRRGFGLRLLQRALQQFQGNVETRFEPAGLICQMSLRLTDENKVAAELAAGAKVLAPSSEQRS